MRIVEIENQSRKIIKQLHNLYTSYILKPSLYSELLDLVNECLNSDDLDVVREANIINQKLIEEFIRMLSE
jgi:hypothetical protein